MPASLKHFQKVAEEARSATDEELLDWIRKSPTGRRTTRSDWAWVILGQRGWDAVEILEASR